MRNTDREPMVGEDLMSEDPVTVHASDTVGRARDLMSALRFHALPVVEGGRTVGIVTTADLADNWPDDTAVNRLMSAAPYRVSRADTVEAAANEMLARGIHHLIVDDPGQESGVLSSFDLLRVLAARNSSR